MLEGAASMGPPRGLRQWYTLEYNLQGFLDENKKRQLIELAIINGTYRPRQENNHEQKGRNITKSFRPRTRTNQTVR